jgi:lipoate-protein ligase A
VDGTVFLHALDAWIFGQSGGCGSGQANRKFMDSSTIDMLQSAAVAHLRFTAHRLGIVERGKYDNVLTGDRISGAAYRVTPALGGLGLSQTG